MVWIGVKSKFSISSLGEPVSFSSILIETVFLDKPENPVLLFEHTEISKESRKTNRNHPTHNY